MAHHASSSRTPSTLMVSANSTPAPRPATTGPHTSCYKSRHQSVDDARCWMLPHIDNCGLSRQPRSSTAGVGTGPGRNAGDFLLPRSRPTSQSCALPSWYSELGVGVSSRVVVVVGPRPGEQVVRDIVEGRTPDLPGRDIMGRSGGRRVDGGRVRGTAGLHAAGASSRLLSDKAGLSPPMAWRWSAWAGATRPTGCLQTAYELAQERRRQAA